MNGFNNKNLSLEDFGRVIADVQRNIDAVSPMARQSIESLTESLGNLITPFAEHPLIQQATKIPGLRWMVAAIGQVDIDKIIREVEELRRTYPNDTDKQLVDRIINDTAWQGGKVGLITNFLPPLAISLLALDVAAVSALQADMIYRIAAVYSHSLREPARRGEVLAIWALSAGGSGIIKSGLSIAEIIPGFGMVVGATGNATLLYSLGHAASAFYASKPA